MAVIEGNFGEGGGQVEITQNIIWLCLDIGVRYSYVAICHDGVDMDKQSTEENYLQRLSNHTKGSEHQMSCHTPLIK